MFSIFDEIVFAYFAADLLAAVFHFVTDRGWNLPHVVRDFQNHHERPETMTFDLQPMLIGLPVGAIGVWSGSTFVIALGLFLSVAQVPHYFSHHPAPGWVKALQNRRLILPPLVHAKHHTSKSFDRDFSVLNGWSNEFFNWILGKAGY